MATSKTAEMRWFLIIIIIIIIIIMESISIALFHIAQSALTLIITQIDRVSI